MHLQAWKATKASGGVQPLQWWSIQKQRRSASSRCHGSGSRSTSPLTSCTILRRPAVAVRPCAQGIWDTMQMGAASAALAAHRRSHNSRNGEYRRRAVRVPYRRCYAVSTAAAPPPPHNPYAVTTRHDPQTSHGCSQAKSAHGIWDTMRSGTDSMLRTNQRGGDGYHGVPNICRTYAKHRNFKRDIVTPQPLHPPTS